MHPIETDRLRLRPITPADEPALFAILSDPIVTRWLFRGGPMTGVEFAKFVAEEFHAHADHPHGMGVIEERAGGRVIGAGGLAPCPVTPGTVELGFILAADRWGQGFAAEIGAAQRDRALWPHERGGLAYPAVYGLAHPDNLGSIATLEKIGLVPIGHAKLSRGPRVVFRTDAR